MRKRFIYSILLFCLASCALQHPQHAPLFFDEIMVRNTTHQDIQNLEIRVNSVNRVFGCGLVIANGFCSNKFKSRPYQGNAITLSWIENQAKISKGPMIVEPPSVISEGNYRIVLNLEPQGAYTTAFILQN